MSVTKNESELKNKKKEPALPNSLGPVANLEEHVPSDWWRRIFNSLYLKTDGDVVEDNNITKTEIDLILDILKFGKNDSILDLCCGQARHTLELAERGFKNIYGLDRSHYLIQKGKERNRKMGYSIKLKEGDARKLPYKTDTFSYVLILGNSFGYFDTLKDDLAVLREVARTLKPHGKVLLDLTDGEYVKNNFAERSWEWIDKKYFVCRERSLAGDGDRLVSREVINHVNKGVIADQFYAERLYSRESLKKLLEDSGFSNVEFPTAFSPDSARNQDLGMMERRIIAVATIKKEWTVVKKTPKTLKKEIVVVMGDPRKPDPIRPDQVFDEDAFVTINKLKESLKELKNFKFSYLDNHDTLIDDLKKVRNRTDLVLNLCDEGYKNNPVLELHVPALLETLDIPYTGSSPQCLAFCYDKSLVRGIAKEMDIPVPEGMFITPEDIAYSVPIEFPVILKPNFGDSSFGITAKNVVYTIKELLSIIQHLRNNFGYEKPLLIEEFLTGKDLTLGIIGNPPSSYTALPIAEEDYSVLPPDLPKICGYEAKWDPKSPYWQLRSIPAELPEKTSKSIVEWSVALSERLGCKDYTRFDWRLDAHGNPKLLEVNPNPGWCWDGHLAKMAQLAGNTYADMLDNIIKAAFERMGVSCDENSVEVKIAAAPVATN